MPRHEGIPDLAVTTIKHWIRNDWGRSSDRSVFPVVFFQPLISSGQSVSSSSYDDVILLVRSILRYSWLTIDTRPYPSDKSPLGLECSRKWPELFFASPSKFFSLLTLGDVRSQVPIISNLCPLLCTVSQRLRCPASIPFLCLPF